MKRRIQVEIQLHTLKAMYAMKTLRRPDAIHSCVDSEAGFCVHESRADKWVQNVAAAVFPITHMLGVVQGA